MTAGMEKIYHPDPRIGFLSGARVLDDGMPALQAALTAAQSSGVAATIQAAEVALHTNRVKHFNAELDAVVTGFFLVLVTAIVALSLWAWIGLLRRRGRVNLQESPTVWLPGYAVAESRPVPVVGLLALGFGLARELSGEAQLERAQRLAVVGTCGHPEHAGQAIATAAGQDGEATAAGPTREQLYVEVTERRFQGVNRCC